MNCLACGAEMPDDNRFCGACGAPQVIACSGCGTENPGANKYCGGCGAPLQGQPELEAATAPTSAPAESEKETPEVPEAEAERRQLTVMFCDLVGSTALSGQLDPEDLREVMQAYRETCAAMIERVDGYVAKYLGDGVLAYFGYPRAHEEDAERAARAGMAILEAMADLSVKQGARIAAPLETRIGIATGLVVVGDMGTGDTRESMSVMGETPNIAARLQALAEPGQLVVGALTRRLIGPAFAFEDLGERELKGVALPLRAFAVRSEDGAAVEQAPEDAPLLGREVEMARLEACWREVKDGHGQIAHISGEPGIGKSRLMRALNDIVVAEGGAWIECHGSPYHGSTPFHPLIELLRSSAGLERSDAPAARLRKLEALLARLALDAAEHMPIVAALLSLEDVGSYAAPELSPRALKDRTLATISAFLAAIAAQQPTVLALEDLHWLDASSLEMLDLLSVDIKDLPIMLVTSQRSDFSHAWPNNAVAAADLALKRLDSDASAALIAHIAGDKKLSDDVSAQIIVRTDGIPSFIEEVTKTILEAGVLRERKGRYEAKGSLPERLIPETLKDSLMARLDSLADAKELAQIGATIGRSFTHELIEAVAKTEAALLVANLSTLNASGLIETFGEAPNAIYTFKQALVQEAAYETLLRQRRQNFHERIAQALEASFPEIVAAQPELLAHHYGVAGRNRSAIQYWMQAGARARKRSAEIEAIEHFSRALELLDKASESAERTAQELTCWTALGQAHLITQGYAAEETLAAFEKAYQLSGRVNDPKQQFLSAWGILAYHFIRGDMARALELSDESIKRAEASGNQSFRAVALGSRGIILHSLGDFESSADQVKRGLALYGPEAQEEMAHLFGLDVAVLSTAYGGRSQWIRGYPDQALEMVERSVTLARERGRPFDLATALSTGTGYARLLRGEVSETRKCATETIEISEAHHFPYLHARGLIELGWCHLQEGDIQLGIERLEEGIAKFRATGALTTMPAAQVLLAEALGASGQAEEGLRVVEEALAYIDESGERDSEAELHRIRGILHLASGADNAAEAEACFNKALEVAREQKARAWKLRAATALARLYHDSGRTEEGRDLLGPLYAWFKEGLESADLRAARAQLELLAATVRDGDKVRIHYTIRSESGKMLDRTRSSSPAEVTVGGSELLPVVSKALIGMVPGGKTELTLTPSLAFGERDEDRMIHVPRASVPEEAKAGDIFTIQHEGQSVLITVLEIEDDFATCDLNHPWAGQTLNYEIKLQKILPGGRQ